MTRDGHVTWKMRMNLVGEKKSRPPSLGDGGAMGRLVDRPCGWQDQGWSQIHVLSPAFPSRLCVLGVIHVGSAHGWGMNYKVSDEVGVHPSCGILRRPVRWLALFRGDDSGIDVRWADVAGGWQSCLGQRKGGDPKQGQCPWA